MKPNNAHSVMTVQITKLERAVGMYTITQTRVCSGYTIGVRIPGNSDAAKIFFDALDNILGQKGIRKENTYTIAFPHNKDNPYQSMVAFLEAVKRFNLETYFDRNKIPNEFPLLMNTLKITLGVKIEERQHQDKIQKDNGPLSPTVLYSRR